MVGREHNPFIYRKGKRWSYGFKGNNAINIQEHEDYKKVRLMEESTKCRTLDNY